MTKASQDRAGPGADPSRQGRAAHHAPGRIEDLIARCALGDRPAFEALYDATSGKLFALCLRVLKTNAAAEDAMQDTYVRIWKTAGRYRVTGQSAMTWLITIARDTAVDHLRARRAHAEMADHADVPVAPAATSDSPSSPGSGVSRIGHCLDRLPEDRGAAIRAAYLDGHSYADLAEHAEVPLTTIRDWLRIGLTALRECMDR